MRFPLPFFEVLVLGALVLSAAGSLALAGLFVLDSIRRRLW